MNVNEDAPPEPGEAGDQEALAVGGNIEGLRFLQTRIEQGLTGACHETICPGLDRHRHHPAVRRDVEHLFPSRRQTGTLPPPSEI